ncbi:MAG: DinB family protein [Bacteroidota bacterium]
MQSTISQLIHQLQKTYNGAAWHGPNMVETLADITTEQATKRVGACNNIAELVHHIYAWRIFIIKRFSGEGEFEVSDDFNFKSFGNLDAATWDALKDKLAQSQDQLIETVKKINPKKLSDQVINRNYTHLDLLHGIIHHDLYHSGQIALLKKC